MNSSSNTGILGIIIIRIIRITIIIITATAASSSLAVALLDARIVAEWELQGVKIGYGFGRIEHDVGLHATQV